MATVAAKRAMTTRAHTDLGDEAETHPRVHELLPGTTLGQYGQYEVIRALGRGGMGVVYLARDLRLGRRVAIKLLGEVRDEYADRMMVEAKATAQCRHENIVVIYEVGEHEGAPFLALEYLEGKALSAKHPRPPERAVEVLVEVLRALETAHGMQIVHRDLKPDNVFLTEQGGVKVLDFGIAKAIRRRRLSPDRPTAIPAIRDDGTVAPPSSVPPPRDPSMPPPALGQHTRDGHVVGTPPYMSPEQVRGEALDGRSDIWAAGILLYELIVGQHPLGESFSSNLLLAVAANAVRMPTVDEMDDAVPKSIASWLERCWRIDARDRPDAKTLREGLEAFLSRSRSGDHPAGDTSPYPGLSNFEERQAGFFFGRSSDVRRVVARLREHPLVTVAGPSGVGKSSLVHAGVVPALARSGEAWETWLLRPGRDPVRALAALVGERCGAETDAVMAEIMEQPGTVAARLRERARRSGSQVLLFVDQFEELYTQHTDAAARRAYVHTLMAIADDVTAPLRVLTSIRSDFVDRMAEDERWMARVTEGLSFLAPLDRDGLREPLVGPAELVDHRFESDALVDEILDALADTRGALPLLQFVAAELWDQRDTERQLLTRAAYEAMGGVEGALATHADSVLADLGPSGERDVRRILLRLVTPERTRAIETVRSIVDETADVDVRLRLQSAIERLVKARLLVANTVGDDTTIEIVHESLITRWPRLARWLDEEKEWVAFRHELRRAADRWANRNEAPGMLWIGDALEEAARWRQRGHLHQLPETLRRFLDASFEQDDRARRAKTRTRWIASVVAALVAIGAVFALVVINGAERRAREEAERARDEAERALSAEARASEAAARATTEARQRAEAEAEARSAFAEAETANREVVQRDEDLQAANTRLQGALRRMEEEAQRARAARSTAEREATRAQMAEVELRRLLDEREDRLRRLESRLQKISTELR